MKQVLITGASTGIGFETTRALLEDGYRVWAGVRKPEVLERLKQDFGDRLTILKLDVTNVDDIEAAFEAVQDQLKEKSEFIVINNAGIANGGPIEGLAIEEWRKVFEVNVFAMVEMTQKFLPILRRTKGRVINIGSISGRIASPFLGPYCASKFAVRSFSDSLRREVGYFGVRVSLIEPGPIRTEIWSKSIRRSDQVASTFTPDVQQAYGKLMESLREGVTKAAEDAAPVELVTKSILHAVESRFPRTNYLVGKNIQLQATLVQFLPASVMDTLVKAGLRFKKG
ncbi:MAG: SDR family oxidoreductase [Bdellovibrio sp.]|nr:SDR family oxidoreductase [Bdellovibrio sp.]